MLIYYGILDNLRNLESSTNSTIYLRFNTNIVEFDNKS